MPALWNRVEGLLFGSAIAGAFSRAVEAVLEPVKQHAWQKNPVKVLDVGRLAELIARGLSPESALVDEANRTGYDENRLQALAALAQSYPGGADLKAGSNRGIITPDLVDKAIARHGIPAEYHGAIKALFLEILSPGELSAAIHRGLVPDPINPATGEGLLKGEQPEPPFNVEPYPVYPIDAAREALGSGYDIDRLGVLVGLQGLPMGTHEAAQAFYKGIITHGDYIRAFNESNSRNEWAQAVLENTRQIPTARDFFENALRGHHTFEWAAEQAARHGMSADDSLVIYQNQGRPINLHQITQALAWGAKYNPGVGDDPDPYMQSVLLGPVRPEYYEMQDALKYNLPSAFYFRALQQQGVLSPDQAFVWYKRLGWPPDLARQVADAYGKAKSAAAKEATASDLLTLWDGGKLTTPETLAALQDLGYPPDEAQRKLDTVEARRVAAATNTAISDIHTVYKKGEMSNASALAGLEALGLSVDGATDIVAAWEAFLTTEGGAPPPTPA